jgi:hypothetical protein
MPENNLEKQAVVLFDEQGTPTFGPKRDTDWFLGVAVVYDLEREKEIFSTCNVLFGLANSKPLKNDRISTPRAERISNLVTKLPVQIEVNSVNLADNKFQQTLTVYEQLGNELRKKHRQVGERKISQILYSQILVETVFTSIVNHLEHNLVSSAISVYVDHHCFPVNDIRIHLESWAQRIEQDVNSFYKQHGPVIYVRTMPVSLMKQDSPQKRFVDVITSVVSRSFLREDSKRFSQVPLQTLLTNDVNRHEDITQKTTVFVMRLMDEMLREPPVS